MSAFGLYPTLGAILTKRKTISKSLQGYEKKLKSIRRSKIRSRKKVEKAFQEYFPDRDFADKLNRQIDRCLESTSPTELIDCMHIAGERLELLDCDPERVIKYFFGVYWNVYREKNGEQ